MNNQNNMTLENVELDDAETIEQMSDEEMKQINGGGVYISVDPLGPGCNAYQN